MLKRTLTAFMLPLLLLFCNSSQNSVAGSKQKSPDAQSGSLEKMIVASGSVAMDIDLNRLNGVNSVTAKRETLRFTVAADSFFTALVFNDVLRGAEQGSIALIPQNSATLPAALSASLNQLVVEKLPSGEAFDLTVRDGKTGFAFFNIEGHQYDYDAKAQLLSIKDGSLLISQEFAKALGHPSGAGSVVGKISIGTSMQPVEIATVVNGTLQSVTMPPLQGATSVGEQAAQPSVGTMPGPDVIVGDLPSVEQGGSNGSFVGLGVGTTSCNNGQQPLHWFSLPNNDHPVIPQNLYRMSGGTSNNDRFEQIGQSWLKHAFYAASEDDCSFGCDGVDGTHLGSGCSDVYEASLNYSQSGLGSRAWVNPFTG